MTLLALATIRNLEREIMTNHIAHTGIRRLATALLGLALVQSAAQAASGSYQGAIDADSGLGLIGQTMRVDFVYDASTAPSSSDSNNALFEGFLTSMSISIGASKWNWNAGGFSSVFLYNNAVLNFSTGVEDRVTAFVGTFNGPSLVGAPAPADDSYSFDLYLFDNVPGGGPDGLAAHATLPATAPNPDLFRIDGNNENSMSLRFFTGNPEVGDHYAISAINVTPVPEPSAVLMLLAGLGLVARRAAQVRTLRS